MNKNKKTNEKIITIRIITKTIIIGSLVATLTVSKVALLGFSTPQTPHPKQLEYLANDYTVAKVEVLNANNQTAGIQDKKRNQVFDFEAETVGATPKSFIPVVGNWLIGQDGGNKVLVVNGRAWSRGQTATGIAERARSLYGKRYAEFLDNVQAFAYYPYAVASGFKNFQQGEIVLRFKGISGRIDQAAGILFNLNPKGDYLALRANPLENNLVLWKFKRGKRSSVKWVRNVSTPSKKWHSLKLVVAGKKLKGYINKKLFLKYRLPQPVSGRIGVWSKADSVVYFDDYKVRLLSKGKY